MIKFKFYGRRKKYDKEFKLKVVEVSFARGKVKEVAEEYGIFQCGVCMSESTN